MSAQPTFATDWEAVVFLGGLRGVFALIVRWIIWSERRDRERMCAHRRARVAGTFARVSSRRDPPGVGSGRAGGERAGLSADAPSAPSTPAGAAERRVAPAGFQQREVVDGR